MKIPKPIKRGDAWRIEFMLDGKRYSSTHDTQMQAKEWAMREMVKAKDDAKRFKDGGLPEHTLNELCQIYIKKVSSTKKGGDIEKLRINAFLTNFPNLAKKTLEQITAKDLIAWRNNRSKEVALSTVRREINLISSIFNYALKELLWIDSNPFIKVTRPQSPKPRQRRVTQDDIDKILIACDYTINTRPITQRHYVAWCFLFAIETAMRAGEIISLEWKNVHSDYVHLPKTKNGTERNVPLLDSASDLLELMRGVDDKQVVPLSSDSLKNVFKRVVKNAGVNDLTFHDTRHEACTRLAQLLDVKDLSKVTGHKDIGILINTYYNPTVSELAAKMRKANN